MRVSFLALFSLVGLFLSSSVSYAASELDNRLDELTQQITQKMGEKSKKKIAVVEFSDLNGNVTDFGKYLSEELITRLVNSGKFEDVIERKLLTKIINEHKLSLTDIVDPSSAKQLGKILGVDAIVSGTVSDLGSNLKVNARLIGTEKGSIFAAASVSIAKDESVNRLINNGNGQETENPQLHEQNVQKERYFIRIYNIDDEGIAYVNGSIVKRVGYQGDSGWFDITDYLRPGKNSVRFILVNGAQGWTYGFQLKKNDNQIIWQDECGRQGSGCRNSDLTKGEVFEKIIEVNYRR